MQVNLKTRSGNRTLVTFDGTQYGLIQSVRMNDDYAPEPATGVGDIHVQEWVPTLARHTLSVSKMVLNKERMVADGIFAKNGDDVLQGLVFDFSVTDKDSGSVLRTYVGCSYASGDVEVTKNAIVVASGTFNCLDVRGVGV